MRGQHARPLLLLDRLDSPPNHRRVRPLRRQLRQQPRPISHRLARLVRLRGGPSDSRGDGPLNANFTILRPEGLEAEGLVESISAFVKAEISLYLSVPSPPGVHPAVADIGDGLLFLVMARDANGIRAMLREVYEDLVADPRVPIAPRQDEPGA